MRTWFPVICLSGLLLLPRSSPAAPATAAAAVFDSIEAAWSQGNVRGVVVHLGERKVSIALPELEDAAGLFSPSQSRLILESYFARTRTLQFQFLDVHLPEGLPPVAAALAVRRVRVAGTGPVNQDRVLVTLAPEGQRWVIAEIVALR